MAVKSRKQREKEQRKESILDAAMQVFQRKGYEATSMDEVAKEAEFSKGTLYLYFDSKYALFAELSNRVLSKVAEGFEAIASEPHTGREMVAQMLRLWANTAGNNIKQFRLAMGWIASDERAESGCSGSDCHRETIGLIIGHLSSAILRGKGDGSIGHQGEPIVLACQLWSGMMGALLFFSRSQDLAESFPVPLPTKDFMNNFVDLLTTGLGAKN